MSAAIFQSAAETWGDGDQYVGDHYAGDHYAGDHYAADLVSDRDREEFDF